MTSERHILVSPARPGPVARRAFLGGGASVAGLALLAGCGAGGAEPEIGPDALRGRRPDGFVEMTMVQAAYYGSASTGRGMLEFRGRRHRFNITGGGVGGIGVAEIEAAGDVYNLRELSRFPGAYGQARTGIAIGMVGGGQMWLENEAGVIMRLRARRQGLMLSLGADAMVIQMA